MSRIAIVTGGAQGIGLALVHHLLLKQWRVVALDRDAAAVRQLRATFTGTPLLALRADVGKESDVKRAFTRMAAWQRQSGEPVGLNLLVNNAGVANPVSGPVERLTLARWRKWQDSHLTGAFLCTRAAVPGLRKRQGRIVNVASTRAFQSEPQCEAYAAAKGGMLALTHALAISLGPEILVNAICPGWIETGPLQKSGARRVVRHRRVDEEQHPAGRVGDPRDVAALVDFLAGDEASFITGQHFIVDGGMTRKMIYAE